MARVHISDLLASLHEPPKAKPKLVARPPSAQSRLRTSRLKGRCADKGCAWPRAGSPARAVHDASARPPPEQQPAAAAAASSKATPRASSLKDGPRQLVLRARSRLNAQLDWQRRLADEYQMFEDCHVPSSSSRCVGPPNPMEAPIMAAGPVPQLRPYAEEIDTSVAVRGGVCKPHAVDDEYTVLADVGDTYLGLVFDGVRIESVAQVSWAALQGVQAGDELLAVNGRLVGKLSPAESAFLVRRIRPLRMRFYRRGGVVDGSGNLSWQGPALDGGLCDGQQHECELGAACDTTMWCCRAARGYGVCKGLQDAAWSSRGSYQPADRCIGSPDSKVHAGFRAARAFAAAVDAGSAGCYEAGRAWQEERSGGGPMHMQGVSTPEKLPRKAPANDGMPTLLAGPYAGDCRSPSRGSPESCGATAKLLCGGGGCPPAAAGLFTPVDSPPAAFSRPGSSASSDWASARVLAAQLQNVLGRQTTSHGGSTPVDTARQLTTQLQNVLEDAAIQGYSPRQEVPRAQEAAVSVCAPAAIPAGDRKFPAVYYERPAGSVLPAPTLLEPQRQLRPGDESEAQWPSARDYAANADAWPPGPPAPGLSPMPSVFPTAFAAAEGEECLEAQGAQEDFHWDYAEEVAAADSD
eukprot:TRINITY_DN1844_c0_g2_i1.p1 TRINITY_DN1844_c0_g2~~TRINITY_DN1844_c0_g2_i1.p1  ORF type:complete len:636 (-),score=126.61 TRINITY_DN1844_c0_g2_i1:93-2000(-)